MTRRFAALASAAVAVAACGAPAAGSATPLGAESADSAPNTPSPEVVDPCPDGSGELDLDGGRGDTEPGGLAAEPRDITGPATAVVGDDVHPVADTVEPRLPVVVRSCDGVEVEITDVSRIVTADLYGTLGEIVFTLGLGDNVVGRDTSMGFAQAVDVPSVTPGGHDLNAEAILDLDPTIVLTDASIGPPEVQQQLRDAGVPVVFFADSRTLDGVADHIGAVAGALGVPDEGRRLIDRVAAEIGEAIAYTPSGVEPLRATFLYIRGAAGVYLMSGPGSGADSLIEAIGAVDVGTDIGLTQPFTPLTSEALIGAEPDVIIMMSDGLESVGGVDGLLDIPGVAQTPAGQNRRIIDMNDTDLLNFGPRSGATIKALAEAVYRP